MLGIAILGLTAAAHGSLGLLGLSVDLEVGGIETQFVLELGNLGNGELGHLLCDPVRPLALNVGLGEDDVNLLEITTGGLTVEEPGEGDGDKVDKREEEVDTPVGLVGEHRSEHDDGEVGNPVHASGSGGGLRTSTEGVDLRGVDPG